MMSQYLRGASCYTPNPAATEPHPYASSNNDFLAFEFVLQQHQKRQLRLYRAEMTSGRRVSFLLNKYAAPARNQTT